MRTKCTTSPKRGFTFVELLLGILLTALVAGAIAAVMTATAQGWAATGQTQSLGLSSRRAAMSVQEHIRQAKLIARVVSGSVDDNTAPAASVMLWLGDGVGAPADELPQLGEMALIEYDPTRRSIVMHKAAGDATVLAAAEIGSAATGASLKASAFHTISLLAGRGDGYDAAVVGNDVAGMELIVPSNTDASRPSVEVILRVQRGSGATAESDTEFATAMLRGPEQP